MSRRRLVVLRGPAGVGKSTLAEALRDRLGYPTAAIDTDIFNWTIVPGESDKQVVYDHVCLLAESYLRYGYDVVLSGLILTHEECGALAALRSEVTVFGGSFHDFYCHASLAVATARSGARDRSIPEELIEQWWEMAHADVKQIPWHVERLDMDQPVAVNVDLIVSLLGP